MPYKEKLKKPSLKPRKKPQYKVVNWTDYNKSLKRRAELSLYFPSGVLRRVQVSYETIRNWCSVWGPVYAKTIRRNRGSPFKDKWHIDEMRIKIKGEIFWLWRMVLHDLRIIVYLFNSPVRL